jgi:hypothetical protein
VERLEEVDVGGVQVAHQVEDGVGGRHLVFARCQERGRAGRHVGRQRGDARRVDECHLPERRRRPLDDETVDVRGVDAAEVDADGAAVAGERHLARLALAGLERGPVGDAVSVPGDDAGALAGVGGRQLLADQRVEQRRLAGLDLAGDGDAQGLVEPVEHGLQPVAGIGHPGVRPGCLFEQAADGVEQVRRGARGHDAAPFPAAGLRSGAST